MSRVRKQTFGGSSPVALNSQSFTITLPKGTKAVLTSMTLTSAAPTGTVLGTVTAAGGATGIFAAIGRGITGTTSTSAVEPSVTLSNGGAPISGVIDATSGAVTLTVATTCSAATDSNSISVVGEYIS